MILSYAQDQQENIITQCMEDDKRFCEYFNITGYIDDDHAEPNSEWETILNTMKEYV